MIPKAILKPTPMPRLFSYVVKHDHGFAPNPSGGFCTLVRCKYGKKKSNIIELAEVGDWVAGTGGAALETSSGNRKLIYAMRVDKKIPLAEYCRAYEKKRIDAKQDDEGGQFALISNHFFYFGRNAIDIKDIPGTHLNHEFEKKGPGHRSDFLDEFVEDFATWLEKTFKSGVHGLPCKPSTNFTAPRCVPKVKRKGCP